MGAAREHGTRVRYVNGPDENGIPGNGCRCRPCTRAHSEAGSRRNRLIAYGQWQPYVSPDRAREHLRMLSSHGIGWRRAAQFSGVSQVTVKRILYTTPERGIKPQTEAAILAVQSSVAPGGYLDAAGTRRRLQALIACGWSQAQLAGRLGRTHYAVGVLLNERGRVQTGTARRIAALYDGLWNSPPPEGTAREKAAASRARNYARARGWALPGAWDDDRIDDPDAQPAEGWQRRERLKGPELAAEARELAGFGLTRAQAAERLGVPLNTLEKTLARYPEMTEDGEAA